MIRQNRSTARRRQPPVSENTLKGVTRHLEGFQTRKARDLDYYNLPWPKHFFALGTVATTWYNSDKDDPLTRPPHLRANDPEGRQGVWKLFRHEHGDDVVVYSGDQMPGCEMWEDWLETTFSQRFQKPDIVWWMAELDHLDCVDFEGNPFQLYSEHKTMLWGTPDVSAIILLPEDLRKATPDQIVVVSGGRMTITPMGIEY